MKSLVTTIIFVLLLATVFTGCAIVKVPVTTTADTLDLTPPKTPTIEKCLSNEGFQTILENSHSVKKQFHSDLFVQDVALSFAYALDVSVENGKIYLNDVEYQQISYVEDYSVQLASGLLAHAEVIGDTVLSVCRTLENQKGFYVLQNGENTKYGHRIALCVLDGICYILSVSESNEVIRIHCGNVNVGG